MHRAFLCHSSDDKDYVRLVASRLGRARVAFDELHFSPSTSIREQIQHHLAASSVFCFFVSRKSLASTWCQLEVDLARARTDLGTLAAHLAIIVDPTVSVAELPEWLRRARVIYQSRPVIAAREVQQALFSTGPTNQQTPFVGRTTELERLTNIISEIETPGPRVLVATGLQGIGRRAVLERFCTEALGLRFGPTFEVDQAADLEDLYLWLLDESGRLEERHHFAELAKQFRDLPKPEQVQRLLAVLEDLFSEGSMPCLVDSGGMLRDDGTWTAGFASLFQALASNKSSEKYLAVLARRKPSVVAMEPSECFHHLHIPPLRDSESSLLLRQLLRRRALHVSSGDEALLLAAVGGYPPAAYFVADYAAEYSLPVLLSDTSLLEEFKARQFGHYLRDLKLNDLEVRVLQYLLRERGVSLTVLSVAVASEPKVIAALTRSLLDRSVLSVVDERIMVAPPLATAVHRQYGQASAFYYENVFKRLVDAFWRSRQLMPSLDVVDATLNALAMSGLKDTTPFDDVLRPSSLFRLAEESYHQKKWPEALGYLKAARSLGGNPHKMKAIEIKALAQLERWEEADLALRELQEHGDRSFHYLRGFVLRRRGRSDEAIPCFERALAAGYRGVAVHRDLADCYWRIGSYDKAMKSIEAAFERDSENPFVLDLCVRICLDSGDSDGAERWMGVLERIDGEKRFVHHRRAVLLASQGHPERALAEAEAAVASGAAPMEAYATRADILIDLGRYPDAARVIDALEARWAGQRMDVQWGLRVKLLCRQGLWREALGVWNRIQSKTSPINQALLKSVLSLKAGDATVSDAERKSARDQAEAIRADDLGRYEVIDEDD